MHTAPSSLSTSPAWRRTLGLLFGLWAALLLVTTLAVYLTGVQRSSGSHWTRALRDVGAFFSGWILLTPLIYQMSSRFHLVPPKYSTLLVHLAASVVAGLLAMALQGLLILSGRGSGLDLESYMAWLQESIWSHIATLPIYWVIAGISTAFLVYDLYRREETHRARIEASLAEARITALRCQMQPHFLFNTLNAIGVLIRSQREHDARRMLTGLADLLRYTLDVQDRPEVTLREELDFIRHYLEVHELRFEDQITTRIQADEAALDALVPNLLLQPLIENALRHGLSKRENPGTLTLQAVRRNQRLRIRIEDDGPGFVGTLEELEQRGMGLKNMRERLAGHRGTESSFRIRQLPEGGTACELDLPLRYDGSLPATQAAQSA